MNEADLTRIRTDPIGGLSALHNGLTEASIAVEPRIADALKTLKHLNSCRLARMSGSGSAVFGLFGTRQEAATAADALQTAHPGWWVRATVLGGWPRESHGNSKVILSGRTPQMPQKPG